jgi:hypothetical protein
LEAQHNPDLSEEERIKIAIDTYFTLRYEAHNSVMEQDFSSLLSDGTLDWVTKEKDRREIERYIDCMFDTGHQSYKFNLDYASIEIKNGNAVALLTESNRVGGSKMGGMSHKITLSKQHHGWVIDNDEYRDELSRGMEHRSKEDIKKQVDENYAMDGGRDTAKCQNIIH